MTDEQIENEAYKIATGTFLTKSFTYKQFQRTNVGNWMLEQYEYFDTNTIIDDICMLAYSIKTAMIKQRG